MQGSLPLFILYLLLGLGSCVVTAANLNTQDPVCGPEIVTIGDAWEKVQLQLKEASQLIQNNTTIQLPQKLAAISAHLRFMQKGAIMIYGKQRDQLNKALSIIDDLRAEMSAASLATPSSNLTEAWHEWQATIQFIAVQFPDEALIPSVSFAHLLPPAMPMLHIQWQPLETLIPNQPVRIVFQLVRQKDLSPVGPKEIISTHGAALHALICDAKLTDYHHHHPTPTGKPGEWQFTFTPKFNGAYRFWINTVPKETGREEFPVNTLSLADPRIFPEPPIFKPTLTAETANLRAKITWNEGELPENKRPISGTLSLSDSRGNPIQNLQPIMSVFAHIVGIAEDLHTILHVHPEGGFAEEGQRGGPVIPFTLRPTISGFHRVFIQVKHDDQIETLEFGFPVK